jgi:hypothetical protein
VGMGQLTRWQKGLAWVYKYESVFLARRSASSISILHTNLKCFGIKRRDYTFA